MLNERASAVDNATARALFGIVHQIIESAEQQHRDLTDLEAGRVDALLDVAGVLAHVADTAERVPDGICG